MRLARSHAAHADHGLLGIDEVQLCQVLSSGLRGQYDVLPGELLQRFRLGEACAFQSAPVSVVFTYLQFLGEKVRQELLSAFEGNLRVDSTHRSKLKRFALFLEKSRFHLVTTPLGGAGSSWS